MSKYLIIFEDGSFRLTDKPSEDDFDCCECQMLGIIDLTTQKYYNTEGEWEEIEHGARN